MDQSHIGYQVMDYLVLVIGSGAAFWIISHFKQVIQTKKEWTAASLTALGFIALGFFTISTPKINKLAIRIGESLFQVGKLEKQIKEKELLIAQQEEELNKIQSRQVAIITDQVSAAEKSGKKIVSAHGSVGISLGKARAIAPNISWSQIINGDDSEKWVILMGGRRNIKPASVDYTNYPPVTMPFLYDTKTGEVQELKIEPQNYKALLEQIKKLNGEASKK